MSHPRKLARPSGRHLQARHRVADRVKGAGDEHRPRSAPARARSAASKSLSTSATMAPSSANASASASSQRAARRRGRRHRQDESRRRPARASRSSRASPCPRSTQSTHGDRLAAARSLRASAATTSAPSGLCATSKMHRPTRWKRPGRRTDRQAARRDRRGWSRTRSPAASSSDEREREVRRLMCARERRAQRRRVRRARRRRTWCRPRATLDVARARLSSPSDPNRDAPAFARALGEQLANLRRRARRSPPARPGLKMPAFSPAISSSVSPRYSV